MKVAECAASQSVGRGPILGNGDVTEGQFQGSSNDGETSLFLRSLLL